MMKDKGTTIIGHYIRLYFVEDGVIFFDDFASCTYKIEHSIRSHVALGFGILVILITLLIKLKVLSFHPLLPFLFVPFLSFDLLIRIKSISKIEGSGLAHIDNANRKQISVLALLNIGYIVCLIGHVSDLLREV